MPTVNAISIWSLRNQLQRLHGDCELLVFPAIWGWVTVRPKLLSAVSWYLTNNRASLPTATRDKVHILGKDPELFVDRFNLPVQYDGDLDELLLDEDATNVIDVNDQ